MMITTNGKDNNSMDLSTVSFWEGNHTPEAFTMSGHSKDLLNGCIMTHIFYTKKGLHHCSQILLTNSFFNSKHKEAPGCSVV